MDRYIGDLTDRLRTAGFAGEAADRHVLGRVLDAAEVADAPIHSLNSGPAMAPVAGRHFAQADTARETAIVADTGYVLRRECRTPGSDPLDARDLCGSRLR